MIIISCVKQNSVIENKSNLVSEEQPNTYIPGEKNKIIVRLRWNGFNHQFPECESGPCGSCSGICVKRVPRGTTSDTPLTQSEINEGDNYVDAVLDNTSICFIPYGNIDNGSGTTRLNEDFFLGDEVSGLFDLNNIKIPAGEYTIDYSGAEEFGVVCFPYVSD